MESFHQAALQRAARETDFSRVPALRAALIAGCAVTVGSALRLGNPAPYLMADPALARLLRAMALIKGSLALAALLASWWRFGWRVDTRISIAYLAATWTMAAAAVLIWQLTLMAFAAVLFHGALIGLLLAAWRDDNKAPKARLGACRT
jgi:hypothetical protein